MKVTKETITQIPEKERPLIKALLDDLEYMNTKSKSELFIDWQDFHDECSPEWTDPCPDYYGYYTIRSVEYPYEILGVEMNIEELDDSMCLLYNYIIDL